MLLQGRNILSNTVSELKEFIQKFIDIHVLIVVYDSRTETRQIDSANVSAQQKQRGFRAIGVPCHVIRVSDNFIAELDSFIERLSQPKKLFYIIQRPAPLALSDYFEDNGIWTDLESVGSSLDYGGMPSTVEAAARLMQPFYRSKMQFAIVGAKGYFGSRISKYLLEMSEEVVLLDKGDDLIGRLRDVNIVVAATGAPHLLGLDHFSPKCIAAIDIGFCVTQGQPTLCLGDIRPSAYRYIKFATPVPGGFGPVQIATVLERAAVRLGCRDFSRWKSPFDLRL